jgi:hypothetical protein
LRLLVAGLSAGIAANLTGYIVTGRWFHRYQALTPHTWRASESWLHYLAASGARGGATIGIGYAYAACAPAAAGYHPLHALVFAACLWAVTALPLVVELSLFVNLSGGFVVGLLLDWLIVYALATSAAALALGLT